MKHFYPIAVFFCVGLYVLPVWADTRLNEARNASFEVTSCCEEKVPEDWQAFTSGDLAMRIDTTAKHEGVQALTLSAQGRAKAHVGVFQNHRVDAGSTYVFEAYVKNDRLSPITDHVYGILGIEWYDVNGKEIARISSQVWTRSLSRMRWETFSVKGRAPPGAVSAHFAVTLLDGETSGSRGSVHVDDVRIARK